MTTENTLKPLILIVNPEEAYTITQIVKDASDIIYGILLTDKPEKAKINEVFDVPILGLLEEKQEFIQMIRDDEKTNYVVIARNSKRQKELEEFLLTETKKSPLNIVHPKSFVADEVQMGNGNIVGPLATINPNVIMDSLNYIANNSVIEERVKIKSYVRIESGAIIRSGVKIEEGAYIGAGAIIYNNVRIGKNAIIGSGSVVIKEVFSEAQVFGVPAMEINKR